MGASKETKYSVCTVCDIGCQLQSRSEGKVPSHQTRQSGTGRQHRHKARRYPDSQSSRPHHQTAEAVGERGEDRWEEISYEQAMDEIAQKLAAITDKYGPESFAVSTSGWNTQTTHSLDRRFMNLLGSPNWISGVALCAGNTAAVNKLTYGWFPMPDYGNTNCIVLFGHNPRKHSWTPDR